MTDYLSGRHKSRAHLGNRPSNSSTPDPGPHGGDKTSCPITHHMRTAHDGHKETVGWVGSTFHTPTYPNSHGMAHGASGSTHEHRQFRANSEDKEPQRRGKTSLKG